MNVSNHRDLLTFTMFHHKVIVGQFKIKRKGQPRVGRYAEI